MTKTARTGHSIRHGYAMPLNVKMERMRKLGYTFERTPNGIIVHPPVKKKGKDCEDAC
jgi:hypothetical protein